ncbi:MAG: sulfite exporter TauE/SafE family protein [Opitutaceae bacterium]|nr:sulfite exporter TauE/SafE family protein [Opitutaceae bacterium]
MGPDLTVLTVNAAVVALVHTAIGPDHYLPFIVLAKSRNWSLAKTAWITFACGVGHVASSVILGMVGYAVGASLHRLEWIESVRGGIAAWCLIGFGTLYAAWGLWRLQRNSPDGHSHDHLIRLHAYDHVHNPRTGEEVSMTPWILFIIFAFGPCEPLIPLFIYPAATSGWTGAWIVAVTFSIVTIGAMLAIVLAAQAGLAWLPTRRFARYSHVIAGSTIALAGGAIQVLGL